MEDFFVSEVLSVAFPFGWAVFSVFLFGKNVFCFVKNQYLDHGMYEGDADTRISSVAQIATLIFVFFSTFDTTGLAELFAKQLCSDPLMTFLLSYPLRWIIASVIDSIFCFIAWRVYLHSYINRSVYA